MKNTLNSIKHHGFLGTAILATFALVSCASNELTEKTLEQKKSEIYYGQGTNDLVRKNYSQALINLLKAKELAPRCTAFPPCILTSIGKTLIKSMITVTS